MLKKITTLANTLIIVLLSHSLSFGQKVIINSNLGKDTIHACVLQPVNFRAYLVIDSDTVSNAFWQWDMDDGTIFSGLNLDSVKYSFSSNRAYRVFAYATYNDSTYCNEIIVEIGLNPFFTGTKSDIPTKQFGICKGDNVTLTGKISSTRHWKEHPVSLYKELFPFNISYSAPYFNAITRKDFPVNQTITSGSDIDSIGLLIEFPNTSNLKITLTAPNSKTIILKNYGGNPNRFGFPRLKQNGAKWYFFSLNADSTINQLSLSDTTIPFNRSYLPEQSFDSLIGSPLNGKWTISVTDINNDYNGYILAWAIYFNPKIVPDTLQYSNTYNLTSAYWSGDNINLTSNGVASAYPDTYGPHRYTFYVNDNFQCTHDTAIIVNVEKPSFKLDKQSTFIGDSIKAQNQTSWAKSCLWTFGDNSAAQTGCTVYHKYLDKGKFLIKLKATSESGCYDFDTAWVLIVPKPIKLPQYNIFTPNGDGINDVFSFFNTPDLKITAANIKSIDGRIYDRDGHLVCHWTTPKQAIKGWDGTINNNGKIPAPEGFYYYIIIITGKDGKKYKPFTGFIYLHR